MLIKLVFFTSQNYFLQNAPVKLFAYCMLKIETLFVVIALLTYKAPEEEVPAKVKEGNKVAGHSSATYCNPAVTPDVSGDGDISKDTRF